MRLSALRFVLLFVLSVGIAIPITLAQQVQYFTNLYTQGVVSTSGHEAFGASSAEDVVGNDYMVFMFQAGSSVTVGEIPLTNQGGFDTALVKYDPVGNIDWVRALQSPGNDEFFAVTTDTAGNVYAVGFTDTAQLGLTIDASWDGILAKYDTNGHLQFITNQYSNLHTRGDQDVLIGITFSNGFLYIVHQSTNSGHNFIYQTDLSGTIQWYYNLPFVSTQGWNFDQIVVDPLRNQLYTAGWIGSGEWSSSVSNGKTVPGFGVEWYDGFLFALGTNGFANWVAPTQTSTYDQLSTVALDAAGNVYTGGCVTQSLDGQPFTAGNQWYLNGYGYNQQCNPIVRKYDSQGNRQWTRIYSQFPNLSIGSIVVDNAGALYARATDGSNQILIKSDTNGNVIWTQSMPGTTGLNRDSSWGNLPNSFSRGGTNAFLDSTGALTLSGVYQGSFYGWASNPFVPYISKWQLNITCSSCQQFDSLLEQLQTLLNVVAN